MRGFVFGLLVGLAAGGGAVYLAEAAPWRNSSAAAAAPDAHLVAARHHGHRRHHHHRGRAAADEIPVLTAADRALVWRGPKITPPARNLDFGSGGGGRPLNRSEINQGIHTRSDEVVACIDRARGRAPLSSTITLKLLVDGHGHVTRVRMRAPTYLFAHGLWQCGRAAAKRMSFPATGAPTPVTVPFDLR